MDDLLVERVLRLAEQVPAGCVTSYGDLAEALGAGPRQVGAVMARWGSGVPWWRVTSASGTLPPHLLPQAAGHWAAEGIDVRHDRSGRLVGVRIARHRWPAAALALAARKVERELAG